MLDDLLLRYPALVPLYRDDPHVRAVLDLGERCGWSAEETLVQALSTVAGAKAEVMQALQRDLETRVPVVFAVPAQMLEPREPSTRLIEMMRRHGKGQG